MNPNNQPSNAPPATLPGVAIPGAGAFQAGGVASNAVPQGVSGDMESAGLSEAGQALSAGGSPGATVPAGHAPMPAAIPGGPAGADVTASQEVISRAQQLTQAYAQDPFQLAILFNDLKADYLAREHHISSNTAGN